MKERISKLIRNPYFMISVIYLLTHFFLLILSGCWWDDWTFSTHNIGYINEVASQSGRPEWNLLIPFCWSLPNNGRFLIFILFYLDSIFVYRILCRCGLFDEKESLIVTLLFTVIPVNDARLLVSNFSYTVGLFFFYLAFMFFVEWNNMPDSRKKRILRVPLLVLFFISFILNSILAYYYIVIAYLFVLDIRENKEENIIKRFFGSVINVLKRYPDFFVIPFVYYIFNKTFFPVYGPNFGGYNEVSLTKLLKCLIYIPLSGLNSLYQVVYSWLSSLSEWYIMLLFAIWAVAVIAFLLLKNKTEEKEYKLSRLLLYLVYGVFLTIMGLLPYVVVREGIIEANGIQGRDSMLLPLGLAIILFSSTLLVSKKYRKIVLVIMLSLGIIRFNLLYLEWQKDYYYQLSMENLLNNKIIRDNDTFFLADLNESELGGQRYYGLNTNGMNVFGDQSRLFLPKVYDLHILESDESIKTIIKKLNYSTMMKDYAPEDNNLDAVLIYSCNLNTYETLRLKAFEHLNKDRFDSEIDNNGQMNIIEVDDDFTKLLFKQLKEGKLNNDEDLLLLLMEYLEDKNG